MKNIFLFLSILLIPQLVSAHTVGPGPGSIIGFLIILTLFVLWIPSINNTPNFLQAWIMWKVVYILLLLMSILVFIFTVINIFDIFGILIVLYFALRKPKDSSNQSTYSLSTIISALIIVVWWAFIGFNICGVVSSICYDGTDGLFVGWIAGAIVSAVVLHLSKNHSKLQSFLQYFNIITLCVIWSFILMFIIISYFWLASRLYILIILILWWIFWWIISYFVYRRKKRIQIENK